MPIEPSLKAVLDGLESLLEREKALLLAGRYDEAGAIARRKEELCEALDRALIDPLNAAQISVFRKRLSALVARAQENEQHLSAAKAGVSMARARLREIMNRERNVGVYGETGEKPLVPNACVTRHKFA
ncbi:MAG: hypothetical protein GC153_13555 [Alphaproteobacteria bacterium]|nr:hypothetical protein [Alphaproteobacteria bacterium]